MKKIAIILITLIISLLILACTKNEANNDEECILDEIESINTDIIMQTLPSAQDTTLPLVVENTEAIETIEEAELFDNSSIFEHIDFEIYAGVYIPCSYINEGETVTNIVLNSDGTIVGGISSIYGHSIDWAATIPTSIVENDDGSITCIIRETDTECEFYILYPVGVNDRYDMFDSSKVRIEYVISGGGIIGYTYYRDDVSNRYNDSAVDSGLLDVDSKSKDSEENCLPNATDETIAVETQPTDMSNTENVEMGGSEESSESTQNDGGAIIEDAFDGKSFWDIINDPENEFVGY